MTDQPDLSALLGSRICHDLISPLGAIGNGVELLTLDSGSSPRAEVVLISEAVASANARIRFLRVAFGSAGAEHRMGRPEITGLLADWTSGGRLEVDWQVPGDLPRRMVRRAFLALLCVESAVPFGGRITVQSAAGRWQLSATGKRLKIDKPLWNMLGNEGSVADLTPAQVQFGLLAQDLAQSGQHTQVRIDETVLTLTYGPQA